MNGSKANSVKKSLTLLALTLSANMPALAIQTQAPISGSPTTTTDQTLERIENKIGAGQKPSEKDFSQLADVVQNQPQNTRAHLVLGHAYEAMSLMGQAVEQYNLAITLSPDDPKPVVNYVQTEIRIGHAENVHELIALAYKRFPEDPNVEFLYGYDQLNHNHIDKARSALREAMRKKPDIPWLNATLAEVFLVDKSYYFALKYALIELAASPNNPKANLVAGLALVNMKKYEPAIRYLGRAAVHDPNNSQLTGSLARLSVWNGQYADAISPFLLTLALTTNQYATDDSNNKMLVECFKHSNKDQALKQVQEICSGFEPAKHNAEFHNLLGGDLAEVGWNEAAIEQFKAALKLSPNFGLAQFNLGKEYEFYTHDYTNALECYRQAQLNAPAQLHAGDYANRLEERLSVRKGDIAWQLRDWFSHPQH